MDPWIQQLAGQGITALLLAAALAWQTRRLTAIEEKLEANREKCEAEQKAERDRRDEELGAEREKRETLEAQHSKTVLALASKTTEAVRFLASELRSRRK